MNPYALLETILAYANKLKFGNLFLITVSLFIADLLIPDFIPLIDEIILGLIAIILANWKKDRTLDKKDDIIEGEIINEDDDKE
jgi:hypothetical protein